ncbi:MAG TPA: flagellar biosynthesis protein FlhB [Stellaceae bacterium]|jgi:flagellar biosynthetic protein FlhB
MAEGGADDESRTEDASQRKLEEARRQGQVPISREVGNWLMLAATGGTVLLVTPSLFGPLQQSLLRFIEQPHAIRLDGAFGEAALDLLRSAATFIAVPLGVAVLAAIGAPLLQNGFVVAAARIEPKLEHLSPLAGLKRVLSVRSVVEFGKGLAKLAIVGAVAAITLLPELDRLPLLTSIDVAALPGELQGQMLRLFAGVAAVLTGLAIFDYGYQYFDFRKSMRMSKQEQKEEYKQTEGDPHIKAKLRQIRMERARKRMMTAVPEASVVITNPTHFAVALKYEMGAAGAPKLVAKGADLVAARIRELAKANDVPLVENPPLARALYASVDLNQEIPPEHYKAVAEIISYVFRLKGKLNAKGS